MVNLTLSDCSDMLWFIPILTLSLGVLLFIVSYVVFKIADTIESHKNEK